MAHYHKDRKEWKQMMQYCEQALTIIPKADENVAPNQIEERMLILLGDAAEGLGDMKRAQECDYKARKIFLASGSTKPFTDLVSCDRREAIRLLAAGKPLEAAHALLCAPKMYAQRLHYTGLNLMDLHDVLEPVMDALKVLADALVQTGNPECVANGELTRADVEETEAILVGYWEGVLEETRWALTEQRREAAAAAVTSVVAEEEWAALSKKSKAAKRKQQKRKAQQQKKAAEKAEAAGGEETQQREEEMNQEEEEEEGNPPDVTAAAAALSAMAVSGVGAQVEEEGEKDKDECSVCLNAIDSSDADNPAGPPLLCGHRYHASCL
jgi:hypothetical protein